MLGEIIDVDSDVIDHTVEESTEPDYYSYIQRIEVVIHDEKKWLKCTTTTGSVLGIQSREMFINAGWFTKAMLANEGDALDFDTPIPVLTEKIDGWFQITEIKRMVDTMLPQAAVEGAGHPPPVVDEDGELFSHAGRQWHQHLTHHASRGRASALPQEVY